MTKNHEFIIGPTDTDSISFCKKNMELFTEVEIQSLIKELNDLSPEYMDWANDGYYSKVLVIRAKNYVLVDEQGKRKIKGSALKATTKEKALKRFLNEVIDLLIEEQEPAIMDLYIRYAREIQNLTDMTEWCSKYTITKAVLEGTGTSQVRIREALKGRPVQEGDKVYQFFKSDTERCMLEDFDGHYDKSILLGKLYDTLCVFETVLDISKYPDLSKKKNKELLSRI